MSHHIRSSMDKARMMNAWAGEPETFALWSLSKRELVEALLRLGALAAGEGDDVDAGLARAIEEIDALRDAGII
jgi:hypothetical protein